jgi:hypothetical protein
MLGCRYNYFLCLVILLPLCFRSENVLSFGPQKKVIAISAEPLIMPGISIFLVSNYACMESESRTFFFWFLYCGSWNQRAMCMTMDKFQAFRNLF